MTVSMNATELVAHRSSLHRIPGTVMRVATTLTVGLLTVAMAGAAVAVFWLHLAVHPILTGSMRPTFGPGWLIVTRPVPVSDVKPGQILLFRPPGSTAAFAHRVISVDRTTSYPVIVTKGDANPVADPWHAQLTGK